MSNPGPNHLKLHVGERPENEAPRVEQSSAVGDLCRALTAVTGWTFSIGPKQPGNSHAFPLTTSDDKGPVLNVTAGTEAAMALPLVQELARGAVGVLTELATYKKALWQREAELAAGVPITSRPNDKQHLAQRLESVLQGGAEAIQCPSAALYLLDEATTELKLRSSFGLARNRLLEPARPLKGSIADLEALVGHAVAIEDVSLLPHWKVPEKCAAALCVPVSTATLPLGTLWFFDQEARDFSSQQTNLAEIIAGRLASDLEREMLLQEGVKTKQVKKQWSSAVAWQQQRLPRVTPVVEGWQLAGWSQQSEGLGGDFYDWNVLADGRLALAVGDAQGSLLMAGLTSSITHAALRAHATHCRDTSQLLGHMNETLWASGTGNEFASLWYGLLDTETGSLECSLAGSTAVLLVRKGQHELLTTNDPPLGSVEETPYQRLRRTLLPGDILVAMSEGVRDARDHGGLRIGESSIVTLVRRAAALTAQELADRIRDLLEDQCPAKQEHDRTVVVLKRRR